MKTLQTLLYSALIALTLCLTSCNHGSVAMGAHLLDSISIDSTMYRAEHRLEPFVRIQTNGTFSLIIQQGSENRLELISKNKEHLDAFSWKQQDGTLSLNIEEEQHKDKEVLRLHLFTTQPIEEMALDGSIALRMQELAGHTSLIVQADGVCYLEFKELNKLNKLRLNIMGVGSAVLAGSVNNLLVDISGVANIEAETLSSQTASFDISGVGTCKLGKVDTLGYDITGTGTLTHKGKPYIKQARLMGAGSIKGED